MTDLLKKLRGRKKVGGPGRPSIGDAAHTHAVKMSCSEAEQGLVRDYWLTLGFTDETQFLRAVLSKHIPQLLTAKAATELGTAMRGGWRR
jgi:hypothetical protein